MRPSCETRPTEAGFSVDFSLTDQSKAFCQASPVTENATRNQKRSA
ncbi:hypothetical protein RSSM_05882 [Rhodopirellula sallentina SM41]|uniref:Uncharacterized protein n=1 Tax=Rhodopirellula sallentina SM41 TaxID=1263870 RepID=M5TU27_9BACT|nr:hypothetical protein RSSM_05882 [Rhodopirellula sallentina SM41]